MERIEFKDYEEFACDVADNFEAIRELDEDNDIAIIAKYEEARQIIKELLCIGYNLHSISIQDVEWDGYDAEYVISLCNIDDEDEIWCEPMLRDNGYITDDSTVIYVIDNCSSEVLKHLDSKFVIYEVGIGGECESDYCVNGESTSKEEFDKYVAQFKKDVEKPANTDTATPPFKSIYRVNGEEVDKKTFDAAMEDIEDRYLDNIRDMLLRYADIMDDMNEWRKFFW